MGLVKDVLSKIEILSKDFDLKFKKEFIGIVILNAEELVLLNYALSPFFKNFGSSTKGKLKNMGKFLNSNEFRNEIKKYPQIGGTTYYNHIQKVRYYLPKIFHKVPKRKVIVYSSKNKEVLLHELIHALTDTNKLRFLNWKDTEALVLYIEYKYLKKLDKLFSKKRGDIWKKAIYFAKMLENKNPKEKKATIKKLIFSSLRN